MVYKHKQDTASLPKLRNCQASSHGVLVIQAPVRVLLATQEVLDRIDKMDHSLIVA